MPYQVAACHDQKEIGVKNLEGKIAVITGRGTAVDSTAARLAGTVPAPIDVNNPSFWDCKSKRERRIELIVGGLSHAALLHSTRLQALSRRQLGRSCVVSS